MNCVMTGSTTTVDYTFEWPSGPEDVVVTGEFDEWKGTMPLLKTSSGDFELTFPVKIPANKEKVFFKFIVDGNWVTSDAYGKDFDENGIENNYISRTEASALSEKPLGTRIPEAGGLVVPTSSFSADEEAIPEPGAFPRTVVDRKGDEGVNAAEPQPKAVPSIPVPTSVAKGMESVTGKPEKTEEPKKTEPTSASIPEPTSTTSAAKPEPEASPKAVKTTQAEELTTAGAPAKPEPAAMPSVAIETVVPEETKAPEVPFEPLGKNLDTCTITSPPKATESISVPEVLQSTAAVKDTALEPMPTASSSDSKKRFKIKRRFKKNKVTGEKTIVSEERIPLDSEESGAEQAVVDEELVPSPTEAAEGEVHIMPIDDPTNGKNTEFKPLAGEPGLAVPANAAEIKEFSEVRDVDVDELNERLNREQKEKEVAAQPLETTSAPKETEKVETPTLDPKTQNELRPKTSNKLYEVANGDNDVPQANADAADVSAAIPAAAATAEVNGAAVQEAAESKSEKKPAIKKTAPTVGKSEEKKKKGGFFSKLKKILR